MGRRSRLIAVAIVGCWTTTGVAQLSTSDRSAVDAYRSAITMAESGVSPRAIEAAFSAFAIIRDALTHVRESQQTVLESLPDEEFSRLTRDLPSAIINREEVVVVEPDPDYFVKLALARGDAADRAFFAALKATYPESVWPVYLDQQTDYSGCTRFGSMRLVETYRAWAEFQRAFPGRYAEGAKKEIDAVLEQLAASTCACGDLGSVELELRRFLETFPTSTARDRVDQRLQALRARRADIRASCISG